MVALRKLGLAFTALSLVGISGPANPGADPVVAARAARAAAQGVAEDDLPPVPRGIAEPPPLPPPEIHPKDLRPRRGARKVKGAVKKGAAVKKAPAKKAPVKKAAKKAAPKKKS